MKSFKQNKIKAFLVILLAVLALVVIITINYRIDKKMNFEADASSDNKVYKYHIAMIGSNPTDEFWTSVYKGAKAAGLELDCYVENFGANLSGEYSVEQLLEMAISAKVDGIILQADTGDTLKASIDEAANQKIPVITLLSDAPNSKRVSFVSCNNYALGELYGKQVLGAIEWDTIEPGEKKRVTVLVDSSDEGSIPNLIFSGIKDATSSVSDKIELSTVVINRRGEFESEEMVRSLILSDTYPDVIVSLSATDTISAYQSVVDYNKVGKVAIIGYYSSDETLDGIGKGIIQATVSINAEDMGLAAINGMHEFITKNYVSEYLSVTSELITSENVNQYMKKDRQESGL